MKKFLATAAAVAALSMPSAAYADDIVGQGTNPAGTFNFPATFLGGIVHAAFDVAALAGVPSYEQSGTNAGNVEAASPTVTNTWLIKGTVTRDCSYYGGTSTAHTLDFGTIGVNTQAATSVNNAFDMVSPANAVVTTTTAGCNFNNTVTLSKQNGAQGLRNATTSGFDSNEFQANIPYSVSAQFNATTNQAAGAVGTQQTLTAAVGDASKVGTYGAWRSGMSLTINAPVPGKALVAGNYSDTLTVTLNAQ